MPLGAEIDGVVLEGIIDLLVDEPAGLRVVDYKTDRLASSDVDSRFGHYRLQGGAYALLVTTVTGRPVTAVDFVFSDAGEVRSLKDAALAAAVEEVRRRLREGAPLDEEGEGGQTTGYEGEPEGELFAMAEPGHDDAREDGGLEGAEDQLGLPL
jgi:RecB family exonuclease